MSAAYFDTSVLVAYYTPEDASARAEARMRATRDRAIGEITDVEVVAALMRKVREGTLAPPGAARVHTLYVQQVGEGLFRRVPLGRGVLDLAAQQLFHAGGRVALRTLDALHVAAAYESGLPLVTCDKRQAQAARALGLSVELL